MFSILKYSRNLLAYLADRNSRYPWLVLKMDHPAFLSNCTDMVKGMHTDQCETVGENKAEQVRRG